MVLLDFTEDSIHSYHFQTCPVPNTTFNTNDHSFSSSIHTDSTRYIVTFNSYELISIHTSFIHDLLSSPSYHITPRNNPSITQYPTDFIIINIHTANSTKHDQILSLLNQSQHIKYTNIDQILHNKKHLLDSNSDPDTHHKRTGGKMFTKFMPFEDDEINHDRSLLGQFLITEHLGAHVLWDDGYDGSGVNVAIFDTGIDINHEHFNNIDERTNWTDEDQLHDGIGHGTFVCGIIASTYDKCPGFAPNASIHTFRVFTNKQMSYTSWFLDAFNYAIHRKMNILNLSIGGPDWLDLPFVDKVREMQANNVIMITACGNDGKYGTINNPADQLSVIGVGGITQNDQHIASFQSRGMTTWELPHGYGRVKPDIVTVGQSLYGSSVNGGCKTLSGTSVASPVATGVAALLTSVVPYDIRWDVINPASLKQIFVESADTIENLRLFEQGNGKINLRTAYQYIQQYRKHVSAVPGELDFTQCPHFWPFCRQPLYYTSEPYIFNLTLLNPFSVIGEIAKKPTFDINIMILADGTELRKEDIKKGAQSDVIRIHFEYNTKLWPWCGWLGLYIYAEELAQNMEVSLVSGIIKVDINVLDDDADRQYNEYDSKWNLHQLSIPFSLRIIPTPPSNKRILWDQYHNLQYPLGYLPRDDLEKDNDMLDWYGDHLHTNYHALFDFLKDKGYFIEILRTDFSCIDPELYSTLIIVDNEDKFDQNELKKLQSDVLNNDLSIIIFADWYNEDLMNDVRFFDDNTRSLWDALTGGANVVALNELLNPFGIQFGDMVGVGDLKIGDHSTYFQSGSIIMKAPMYSYVMISELHHLTRAKRAMNKDRKLYKAIPLVMYDTKHIHKGLNPGRIAVFGDSTCLDANQHRINCYFLMEMMLRYTNYNEMDHDLEGVMTEISETNIDNIFDSTYLSRMNVPKIVDNVESLFNEISRVHHLSHVQCKSNMENVMDIDSMDIIKNDGNKQLKSGVIEVGEPLVRDAVENANENGNRNEYKFVIAPHVDTDGLGIHHYDIMLLYPFIIVLLFILMVFMICRPIQKLFLCDKIGSRIQSYLPFKAPSKRGRASPLLLRKIEVGNKHQNSSKKTEHYHV